MMSVAFLAMTFARNAHALQTRKYTGVPYAQHLAEVAGIVAAVAPPYIADEMIAVAWLHDCLEDTQTTASGLRTVFGERIASGVRLLTNAETGNRAQRKLLSRNRLAKAPAWVQTIKCADIASNAPSIKLHDPEFAAVYLEEARALLDCLHEADPRIKNMALDGL